MWSAFRIPVARVCKQLNCSYLDRQVELHDRNCTVCGCELVLLTQPDRKSMGFAIGGACLVLACFAYGGWAWREHRAEVGQAAVLELGEERFRSALIGAKASQVPAILDEIQKELDLSPDQREALIARAKATIQGLPRDLDASLRLQLESFVRGALADGDFNIGERSELDSLVAAQRIDRTAAADFITGTENRIRKAGRNISRARAALQRDSLSEAEIELDEAVEIDPKNSVAWANLGVVQSLRGRREEARSSYRQALELDPRNWLAHFNLALAAARRGDRGAALAGIVAAFESLSPGAEQERRAIAKEVLSDPTFADVRSDSRLGGFLDGSGYGSAAAR